MVDPILNISSIFVTCHMYVHRRGMASERMLAARITVLKGVLTSVRVVPAAGEWTILNPPPPPPACFYGRTRCPPTNMTERTHTAHTGKIKAAEKQTAFSLVV